MMNEQFDIIQLVTMIISTKLNAAPVFQAYAYGTPGTPAWNGVTLSKQARRGKTYEEQQELRQRKYAAQLRRDIEIACQQLDVPNMLPPVTSDNG